MASKAGLLSVAAFVGGLLGCGMNHGQEGESDLAIVGGELVTGTSPVAKSTVALLTPEGHTFCTGTLIEKSLVVTAAHCLDNYSADHVYVAFGPNQRRPVASLLRRSTSFRIHQSFSMAAMETEGQPVNDIALVRLEEAAPGGYTPATALTQGQALKVGEPLILAGFGLTASSSKATGTLYEVVTALVKEDRTAKEIVFGGHPGKSACRGDSGGPAYATRGAAIVLLGVTSRGSSKCDQFGIYTDVRFFRPWLTEAAATL